jgi:hypothetical protein
MLKSTAESNTCALCERTVSQVTMHHLVPKEEGGKYSETVPLCQPCHSTLHTLFTNKELRTQFNTIAKLQSAERLQTYLHWIKSKKLERIANRRKNANRRKKR